MFYLGAPSIQAKRLVEATYEAMWRGIRAVKPGARLGDIGHTIQEFAEGHHFSIVREFCGHGIGRQFHEEPQVVHYGRPGTGLQLLPGMIFTIEPMINAGRAAIRAPRRRLDDRHRRSFAVRAMGAHGARDARRLRSAHAVGRARRRRRRVTHAPRGDFSP